MSEPEEFRPEPTSATPTGVPLGPDERYVVVLDQPLRQLNLPGTSAFAAFDRQDPGAAAFALLLPAGRVPRHQTLEQIMARGATGLLKPLAAAFIGQDGTGPRRFAIVYERPQGGRLSEIGPMPEREILQRIVPPLLEALESFASRGLTHRAIRLGNIFFLDRDRKVPVLGDCASEPPGAGQPSIYEPLERATAIPEGRGEGNSGTDLYAFGVTLAGLLRGFDPADIEDNVAARVLHGSYGLLVGRNRFSPAMESLLYGLLNDEPAMRWNIDTLRRWRTGVLEPPRQATGERPVARPFNFRGKEWRHPRLLAAEMAAYPREAAAAAREITFEAWVRHTLSDTIAADAVKEALGRYAQQAPDANNEAVLVARICQALDPRGPLRFRDMVVMRDGIVPAIAAAIISGDRHKLKSLADLLAGPLLADAGRPNAGRAPAASDGPGRLNNQLLLALQNWVRDVSVGAGLERCLYELCPTLPCQSPIITGDGDGVPGILAALERAALESDSSRNLLDRHILAFLAARSQPLSRRVYLLSRSENDPVQKVLSTIGLLAEIQFQCDAGALPGLAGWAAAQLVPAIEGMKGATSRKYMIDLLPSLAVKGNLSLLVNGLSLGQKLSDDRTGFERAKHQYVWLDQAIRKIDRSGPARAEAARANGQWLAAAASFVIMLLSGSVLLLRMFV